MSIYMRQTLAILIVAMTALSARAELCQIERSGTPSGEVRVAKIRFLDGRILTVIGHDHGDRNESDINKLARTLKHYREDLTIIRKSLRPKSFLAWETSQDLVKPQLENLIELRKNQSDDVVLLAGGPVTYLQMTEPDILKNIEIVGFEDAALATEDFKQFENAKQKFNVLLAKEKGNAHFEFMANAYRSSLLYEIYPQYDPANPALDAAIIKLAVSVMPEQHEAEMRAFVEATLKHFKTMFRREALTAQRILLQKKSGILVTGKVHLLPMAARLSKACSKDPSS